MSSTIEYKKFDAAIVPLQGSNLIEASAGTGKTYSIAIMVVRLVLQKNFSVKEILMVTFTKAAVAELEERIRLFIRCAYKVSLGEKIGDDTITKLVEEAITIDGADKVQCILKEAVLYLDETSVLTIHSFCQQSLTEFAFETGQIFGSETLQDSGSLVTEEVNKFWRAQITTLPVELLNYLLSIGISQASLKAILKENLNGKKFIKYDHNETYDCDSEDHTNWLQELEELKKKETDLRECLEKHINDYKDEIICKSKHNKYALDNALPKIHNCREFLNFLWDKRSLKNIEKVFPDLLERLGECNDALEECNKAIQQVINHLYCLLIQQAKEGIHHFKQRNNLLTFDDMIVNLHHALLTAKSDKLVQALQKKYKAVFVDEFQDTDRLQYEIFQKAFDANTILFYIGDPKQSIYAWRKADILTYFEARKAVGTVYCMNQNYRSSTTFIEAMNAFFTIDDPFCFAGESDSIDYSKVDDPACNKKGRLLKNGAADVPISIFYQDNKPAICKAVAAQVADLLYAGNYAIEKKGEAKKITPSDIGILVRSNKEGASIKAQLAKYGIPAVTIGDAKLLQSEEATYVLYLLQAMEQGTKAAVNRALLSPFTGFDVTTILKLKDEKAVAFFKEYKRTWEEDGVYTALMNFVADYNVRQVLLGGNTENGERIITNLFQLIEIVHKVQTHKNFSPLELIGWLKRGIAGMETEGDEYEQRVESDEEAVKIVTIHKSKGLEYNIVLAPFLDFLIDKDRDLYSFRQPGGEYVSIQKKQMSGEQEGLLYRQSEQENRRLIYVAITRAVYKCFIYKNTCTKANHNCTASSLAPFVTASSATACSLINSPEPPDIPQGYHYAKHQKGSALTGGLIATNFTLLQKAWCRMSYSSLSVKGEPSLKSQTAQYKNDYDGFVFKELMRGVYTGNMLHYIFENINFADDSKWNRVLHEATSLFAPKQKKAYLPMLHQLLQQVMHTSIQIGGEAFTLSEVANQKRIHEFEFDFTVPPFTPRALNHLSDEAITVNVKNLTDAEGVMNGKMDLFFECRGKYFILDWKSNFLGDAVEDYSKEGLALAMNENNYHLQYFLYTLAAKKYLESRLGEGFDYERDFGGVVYLFLRGMRNGTSSGIFTCKPGIKQLEKLNEMLTTKYMMPSVSGHSLNNVGEQVL